MDEAFSALDVLTSHTAPKATALHLVAEQKNRLRTILLVTHNIEEAATCAGPRRAALAGQPGKITHELPMQHPTPTPVNEYRRVDTRVETSSTGLMNGPASGNLFVDHGLHAS